MRPLLVLLLAVFVSNTAQHAWAEQVLVIVSANAEWREVKKLFPGERYEMGPYGEFFRKKLSGQTAVVVHGGWGKIAAAGSAEWAISRFTPTIVVNLGTCGGIRGRIARFTTVAANKTVAYDILEQMGDPEGALRHYTTDLDVAWAKDSKMVIAPMLSADRDLVISDIPALVKKYDAVVVDWESASIAWVAAKHKRKVAIIRGVSDLVGPDGGDAYGKEQHFEQGTAVVMKRLFDGLPQWLTALGVPSQKVR